MNIFQHLDDPTKPVSLIDVYHEFNNEISEELNLKSFKSRKVTKNYCFDPTVPAQSEYLEVKYSVNIFLKVSVYITVTPFFYFRLIVQG